MIGRNLFALACFLIVVLLTIWLFLPSRPNGLKKKMKTDDYIQSLIERDIPYKPDGIFRDTYKYYGTVCGYVFWGRCKCGEAVWELSKYCDECGQKLDWGDTQK